ncbi:PilZ domain-containing protein [Pseudomonas sp. NPDC007930]|uniref:PilZ domain-containing protein n=1 Tax=Pseudomonas sp. NPDC007930 TaxID=3364417 RepID=UPI0036E5513F
MAKFIERRIERHQLPYYLKVYNRYTDQPIGYLGNVSEAGLMLISQLPLLVGPDFELQLKVPEADGSVQLINLTASCLWCQEDATPGHYDSGFMLLQAPAEYEQLVQVLRQYFSFLPMSASA